MAGGDLPDQGRTFLDVFVVSKVLLSTICSLSLLLIDLDLTLIFEENTGELLEKSLLFISITQVLSCGTVEHKILRYRVLTLHF